MLTQAIKTDGTRWVWGSNIQGMLGIGTTSSAAAPPQAFPIQAGTVTDWSCVSSGYACTLGIRDDGGLWAWGNNGWSQLGDGTTTLRNYPILVGADFRVPDN
jgi:alpha-tubulin suppressor-like RCC1 family protein